MEEIYSITEAYSMQPKTFAIGDQMYQRSDKCFGRETYIEKIIQRMIMIDGDPFEYYVGYDASNNKLFEFKKDTVNVIYKIIK